MNGLLNLQAIALRGDGLHPLLLAHFEAREALAASGVVELSPAGGQPHVQAGPSPQGRMPDFLPGNVVPMDAYRRALPAAARKSSS